MLTGYVITCDNCGYMSSERKDFMKMPDGPLCPSCYDEIVYGVPAHMMLKKEESRKAEALAYAINTDYLE